MKKCGPCEKCANSVVGGGLLGLFLWCVPNGFRWMAFVGFMALAFLIRTELDRREP